MYLTEDGAVTSKEFRDIEKQYSRNRPKMEAIVELLISKRDLQRFIGLSAVWYRYAECDAEELFPFISELGDLHPKKGRLTVKASMKVVFVRVCVCVCMCACVCVYCVCICMCVCGLTL